jgi:hypothetical protein
VEPVEVAPDVVPGLAGGGLDPQRHVRIMPNRRLPLVSDLA